ncbi:hypothetical protein EYR41_004648 [Orbilia oligospora]|uniref:Uncharacterized protein n=1 Tax=Orbilia oligospora TaxID=2813651 RepID=A0A8H2E8Q8_ORBOL|nr:hypothetical protein EYR41_004648 [Orbilia oligospora]
MSRIQDFLVSLAFRMGSIKPLIALVFTLTFSVWLCAGIPTPTLPDSATHHGLNLYDDIEWTSPVAPGGSNYTFFGSIESIKAQIESTPGFDTSVFNIASTVNEPDLLLKSGGNYIIECSRTSDQRSGASLLDYISALDKVKNFHGSCSITGRACKRFGCGKDESIGLCVTRETPFNIECKEVFRLADILITTLVNDYTGKAPNKCQLLKGDKKSAIYYSSDMYWSLDGKWWSISAWHSSCLLQLWLTIPSPWPQRASNFEPSP